jgi:hypothetical protein
LDPALLHEDAAVMLLGLECFAAVIAWHNFTPLS